MSTERYYGVITLKAGIGVFDYTCNLFVVIDASRIIEPPPPKEGSEEGISYHRLVVFFGTPEAIVDLTNHCCGAAFGVGELFWIEGNYISIQTLAMFESPESYIIALSHVEESHFDTGGVYLVQTAISQESLVVAGMFKLGETALIHEETVIYSQQVHEVTLAGVAEAAIIENTGMVALALLLHSEVSSRSQE